MKQFISLSILFLLTTMFGYSQTIELSVESGLASFNMSELKDINTQEQKRLPFKTEITYNFPAYIYYKPMMLINFKRLSFGVSTAFYSTGSRISRQDYSGDYIFDMLISSWTPGAEGLVRLFTKNNHSVQLGLSGGAIFSKLEVNNHLSLYDSVLTKNSITLKGTNIFVIPSIRYNYQVKSIKFGANVGYFTQFLDKPLHLASNSEEETRIKPDWSGLRVGLFVSYIFNE